MSKIDALKLPASVKLVIWDLDETFWDGTLSEGGIAPVATHVAMIRTLVDRGIMCAVCSKNDCVAAQAELERLGVKEFFVFSHIDWTPKGQAIAAMLDAMGLRAENALFLDDNHLNIEEALFFNEGLCAFDPTGMDLPALLDADAFRGKDDQDHTRLKQYRLMEQKRQVRADTGLSNEAFLRQSDVRIKVITDIDGQMDRVLELLNRTNQLNYTKVRANTAVQQAALSDLLKVSGVHAGLVQVQDRYGDYGIVGFFCVHSRSSGITVRHLAFSCRMLNMGVEQWVWEYLGQPAVTPAAPVANPIKSFDKVNWIRQVSDFDADAMGPARTLCLVGGCDLQQVSFYCGTDRAEFVNKQDDQGLLVRFDDIGFFLNPRDPELQWSRVLTEMVGYTYQDMVDFDAALESSDVILLSMFFSVPTDNLFTFGGQEFGGKYWATLPPARLRQMMCDPTLAIRFAKTMFHRRMSLDARIAMTRDSLAAAAARRKAGAVVFILSAVAEHGAQAERVKLPRLAYNEMARAFCDATPGAVFIDIEALLADEDFNDSDHYTRTGYYKIAQFVNDRMDALGEDDRAATGAPVDAGDEAAKTKSDADDAKVAGDADDAGDVDDAEDFEWADALADFSEAEIAGFDHATLSRSEAG